jgi:hypothetical protein
LLAAAVAASCLGGQTGQPTLAACERKQQRDDALWGGIRIAELQHAFDGEHTADLHWFTEPEGSSTLRPVELRDSIRFSVRLDTDTPAQIDCASNLILHAAVEIETGASGLLAAGPVDLKLEHTDTPLRAKLSLLGSELSVEAQLTQTDTGEAPVGSLRPLSGGNAPGSQALFPLPLTVPQGPAIAAGGAAGEEE